MRSVEVQARDAVTARSDGARKLGVAAADVEASESGPGRFRVTVTRADASITVAISEDRMTALLASVVPPVGAGRGLGADAIRQALRQAGVTAQPDPQAIAAAVAKAARGEDPAGTQLASGTSAEPAEDARLEVLGNHAAPVFAGDVFARRIAAKAAKTGRTVDGHEVRPEGKQTAKNLKLVVRTGARLETDGSIRAECWGLAHVAEEEIHVTPLLEISPDKLEAFAALHPADFLGRPVTVERVVQALAATGMRDPPSAASRELLAQALARAKEQPGVRVSLARGVAAVPGVDGKLELVMGVAAVAGKVHDDGTIDYRERDLIHSAKRGDRLGRVVPPTRGTSGRDVFGRTLPAVDGKAVELSLAGGVSRAADGTLTATSDGVVVCSRGSLAVTQVLNVSGDVDYSSGNLHAEHGSVSVQGSIRTGFSVACAGSLIVGDTVGGAVVDVGGDIEVRRGISMHGKGRLAAGGSIRCHFAENARLQARGDVVVDNDCTNSEVTAGGRVLATKGRGRIQGGVVRAGRGVEANELGSELQTSTLIQLEQESPERERLQRELALAEEAVREATRVVGTGDGAALLQSVAESRRRAIAATLAARDAAQRRVHELRTALEAELLRLAQGAGGSVLARRRIHPGVIVVIGGMRLEVDTSIPGGRIYLEVAERRIAIAAA